MAEKNVQNDFSKGSIPAVVMRMALPLIAAQLVNVLYNVVDRIYIGHIPNVGSMALTGVGIALPVISILSAFAGLFGQGGARLVAHAVHTHEELPHHRHQQVAALGLHLEAVAQHAHHVHAVAHGAVGQPLGTLAPDLKDDGQQVARVVLLAGADGDGPPQQQAVAALDVDELAGALAGGADHVAHLQDHIDSISHLLFGDDLALAFYFHHNTTFTRPVGKKSDPKGSGDD